MEWYFVIRTIIRWFLLILTTTSVALLFYHFIKCFIKKKRWCYFITILLVLLCMLWYFLDRPKVGVVHMQENVLYISPSNDIE